MTKTSAREKYTSVQSVQNGWERVLSDGEASLAKAKAQVKTIRTSLRAIRQKIQRGDPFPEYLQRAQR